MARPKGVYETWPPSRVERLRSLRALGLTFNECGLTLGATRNSIASAVRRYCNGKPDAPNPRPSQRFIEPWAEYAARRRRERAAAKG